MLDFWDATPLDWRWQVEGYHRRRLHSMQDLAQHFIWVKSLVTKKGVRRADQLVRDPLENKIYSSDFNEPGEFSAEVKKHYRGDGG